MKTWLRKLRGVASIGATWGLACSTLGIAIGAIVSMIWPDILPFTVVKYVANVALWYGVGGFVLGSGFAVVLTTVDGRKTFEELTPWRTALWGALTGMGLAIGVGLVVGDTPLAVFVASACAIGTVTAGLAAGTVLLARRAPVELGAGAVLDESKLPDDSGESTKLQIGSEQAERLNGRVDP